MDEWQKDFWTAFETVAGEVEQLLVNATKDIAEVVDAFIDFSDDLSEQIQTTFMFDVEQRFNDLVDPLLDAYLGFENSVEEAAHPLTQTVEPILNQHSTCVGCRHYHGQSYGGNVLVCGMHPYGWDGETCPDWHSTWDMS